MLIFFEEGFNRRFICRVIVVCLFIRSMFWIYIFRDMFGFSLVVFRNFKVIFIIDRVL